VTEVDVAIVGARIGGGVLAALLGEAGYRVLLVDAARFPSDTISTHFFRGAGLVSVLARLGILDQVLGYGSPRLTRQYSYYGEDPAPVEDPPQDPGEPGFCLSMRRLPLDALLLDRARSTRGVEVREQTVARDVLRDGDRITGLVLESQGRREDVTATIVVGAEGRGSRVARLVGAAEEQHATATRAMFFRYARGWRGPGNTWEAPEFSIVGDEMVYVFPSDDDVACMAVSINLSTFEEFRHRPVDAFGERLARHPGIAERLGRLEFISGVLGSGPVDAVVRAPSGPGWALVGDASLHQDPWTGLGMDNAGVHATYLAEAIDDCLAGRSSEDEAFAEYHRRRDARALDAWRTTAELGRDLRQLLPTA
jgi:flavin-dependent dehydrogenase